jgi:hypothetical protein
VYDETAANALGFDTPVLSDLAFRLSVSERSMMLVGSAPVPGNSLSNPSVPALGALSF